MNKQEVEKTLNNLLSTLEQNFKYTYGKKIPFDDVFKLMKDTETILNLYTNVDTIKCSDESKKRFIPLLRLLIAVDSDYEHLIEYQAMLKNAYKLSARHDFESFLIYYEWDNKEKLYETRIKILQPYAYFLNKMVFDKNFETLIVNLPSGYGKQIADFEPVLTKDGWKKHGDLTTNDYVIGRDGKFKKVLQIHPKIISNRKVTFDDGETIVCHARHEWVVYDRHSHTEKTLETDYIMEHLYEKDGRTRFLIPKNNIFQGEKKELAIDPYTFGVWLGDGSTYKGCITENVEDMKIMINYIKYENTSTNNGINEKVKVYNFTGLLTDLHKYNLGFKGSEKEIPNDYLTSNVEQRLELLAGMMDSDGYFDKVKQRYIYCTTSEKLRDGVVTLANSFGWRTSVTKVPPKKSTSHIQGKKMIYYIGFSPDFEIPCKLERKKIKKLHKKRNIGIEKIEIDNNGYQGNCITVEDGCYLVGKTLKLTHNSRLVRLYEAFSFGIKPHATFLALCSNDDLIRGQSRSVIDIIKSEKFGEVFPKMKYDKNRDRDYFLKSTDAEWRLFTCKSISSYYAKSTQSNVVGVRVNDASVDIDDLYSDFQEALNPTLNKYYFNKFITVWRERHNTNETYKSVITGTLWSSGDFIDLAIQWLEGRSKFKKHPKFDFTRISEDGKSAIIQVPALDYETGESTCPEIISTKDLLIKKNSIDPYLWSTNYQQLPQNPDMMEFSYEKLKTYDVMPEMADKYTKAVIDGTRKGGDFFSMPIFQPYGEDWALIDCIFTKQATSELIDEIVGKIIEHHIIYLVVESNVDGGLKKILDEKLQLKGITWCIIVEKYNTVQKKIRIEVNKGTTLRRIYFPKKEMFGTNTEMGKFMESFTLYNSDGRNAHDDANDSTAMFSSEIIEENSKPQKAEVLDFVRRYM